MAASLTDGAGNYITGGVSPLVPPASAPPASTSVKAPLASPVAAPAAAAPAAGVPAAPVTKPVSTVSSKPAADMVNNKIIPTMQNGANDVAAQNAARAASLAAGYVYNVPDGNGGFYSGPASGAPKPATPTSTTPNNSTGANAGTAVPPPPSVGNRYIYDANGNQSQIGVNDAIPAGFSTTNPTVPPKPVAPSQPVVDTTTDPVGNTYKQFADGTYGQFDSTGNYVQAVNQQVFQSNKDGQSIIQSFNQAVNGTYPLTASQQAQIQSIKDAYAGLIRDQGVANANFTGGMTVAQNLYGMGNTITGMGEIKATVDQGIAKIADLNSKMNSAVAQMQSAFESDNLARLKAGFDAYNTLATERQNEIDKQLKVAADAKQAAQDEADKQRAYELDVKKFQQTGDQNSLMNALNAEQEAEAVRHNKATEAIDAFKAGMGAGGGDGTGGVNSSAVMGADGKPDPQSQQGVIDQITSKYGPMTAVAIKGLADYSINPTDWRPGAAHGLTRDQAVALAKMYDPTYSDAQFPVRQAFLKSLASNTTGTIGSAVNAANKSINHLTAFVNDMSHVGSTNSSIVNMVLQNTAGQAIPSVRTNLRSAKVEGMGVADELAKFFKGVGVTDTKSIEDWKGQLSTSATPSDVHGLVQGAVTLLAGQLETLSEQYNNTMGHPPANTFLGPSAIANLSALKNAGYEVNIPGVNYTDKTAWQNNGGSQQDWNTAVDRLNAIGAPLTQENILQAAQNL